MKDLSSYKPNRMTLVWINIVFILVGLMIYSGSFNVPFIFDDNPNIKSNEHIRISEWSLDSMYRAGFKGQNKNRPVSNLSFALNFYVHEYDVFGYHLVNVVIHIINGILVFFLFNLTLMLLEKRTPDQDSGHQTFTMVAALAALLWFVWPVQTQSVTYIVQRMNSLSVMFYLLSLTCYIKGRLGKNTKAGMAYICGSILSALLALGSKEMAVTLPVFIGLFEYFFFQDMNFNMTKRQMAVIVTACLVMILSVMFFLGSSPIDRILNGYIGRDFTLVQRVLTEFRILIYYLTLFIFPHPSRLHLDYDVSLSHSLLDPISTLMSLLLIIVLLFIAVFTAKKMRLFSFAIIWYFGNLAIESTIIPLELVYEHRLYLPTVFLFLAFTDGIFRLARTQALRKGVTVTLIILIAVWSYWTYDRNRVWQSDLSLWQDNALKTPNDGRVYYNLGIAYRNRGDWENAAENYKKAIDLKLNKELEDAHNSLGIALFELGKKDAALAHFNKALEIDPANYKALYNLGNVYKEEKQYLKAIDYYKKILDVNPENKEAQNSLRAVMNVREAIGKALAEANEKLKEQPDNVELLYKSAMLHIQNEEPDSAIALFEKILAIQPKLPQALMKLANLYIQKKNYAGAVEALVKIHDIQPDNAVIQYNIACLEARRSNTEQALDWLKKAVDDGYDNWDKIANDSDLSILKTTPFVQSLLEKR